MPPAAGCARSRQTAPEPGVDVHLHLDIGLQEVAMKAFGDNNGAAVAINPQNGGVLAFVSQPGYDPNLFVEGISRKNYQALQEDDSRPLYNRALRGQYPPGSTVKPFMGLAGLERNAIQFDSSVYCPGFYQLPGNTHRYRDWKKGGHGLMDIESAIVQSCDVFFYKLAHDLGVDQLQGLPVALRLRPPHRDRPHRRVDRPAAVTGLEETCPTPALVSGRDPDHGHRSGLLSDHAPAAGRGDRGHRQQRHLLHSARGRIPAHP